MEMDGPTDIDGAAGLRLPRTSTAVLALLVIVMVSVGLAVTSVDDGEVRSVADGDNSYMDDAQYLTSTECIDCHEGPGGTWGETPHGA